MNMLNRRSDRERLVQPESSEPPSEPSTLKFAPSSSSSADAESTTSQQQKEDGQQQEHSLGAEDVQQARQLQLQYPQAPLRKCEFCRKPVLPQKEVRSCSGSERVVHAACADAERRYEDKRAEAERAESRSRAVEEQHECIICQRAQYRRREGAPGIVLREDTRWIKPCFCEVYAHHGCLAGVVATRQTCPQCGERYEYREYGSLLDFLSRYWLSYCFIGSIVGFFCLVAVYTMVNAVVYPTSSWQSHRVALLVVGVFLTIVALCCVGSCLRYTFGHRVPRFKSKYSFVRVSNWTPPPPTRTTASAGKKKNKEKAAMRTSLLLTQVPRKASDRGRSLLSFSLPSDDSVVLNSGELPSHEFQYTSTPKIAGTSIPFDFNTPSSIVGRVNRQSPKSFRRLEEHPLRLTLERVPEMPEEDSISYDDTAKELLV